MDKQQHHISIFTTASLPWLTGTAVNPLFRAAYLAADEQRKVTLVIPWLSLKDQHLVYPEDITFSLPLQQEKYVLEWLEQRIGFTARFNIRFYPGKVIRLSAATQNFSRSIICNVHGVNPKFLEIGVKKNEQQQNGELAFGKGAYYIGKMVWNKGYRELLTLLQDHQTELAGIEVDLYGNGEDSVEIQETAKKLELAVRVHPGRDHADPLFHDYKVLLNPSTTDVVCTTTAEALAMGKIVVCANHPSNDFFKQFPNCRMYNDGNEFVEVTKKALSDEEPAPMRDDQRHELSWEAATERFLKAVQLDVLPTSTASKKVKWTSSRLYLSTSLSLRRRLEDASALMHFMGTGVVSEVPDEEQCRELGLDSRRRSIYKGKLGF